MTNRTGSLSGILAIFLAVLAVARATTPSPPTFLARHDYLLVNSYWVQAGDTNGDGIPDLIGDSTGYIEVLFGNGDGTFRPGVNSLTGVRASQCIAIDLNGDGIVDLVQPGTVEGNDGTTVYGIGVSLGFGDGTYQTGVFYEIPDSIGYAVIGDFNGDGITDVAAAGSRGVWLLTGRGGGILNFANLAAPLPSSSYQIAAADFNGDGKLDIVVTGGAGFSVLFGRGDGSFKPPVIFSQVTSTGPVAAGKLTRDGRAGIAIVGAGPSGSGVYVYTSNGHGFSGPVYVNLPGISYRQGLAIGDINGDGIGDLVSGGVYVAFGTPSGVFAPPIYYPVSFSNNFFNVTLADLRNNGQLDIASDSDKAISVLLNAGHGRIEDGHWTPVPGGGNCAAAADFNADGKPDLAVNNAQGVTILLGTGIARTPLVPRSAIGLPNAGCVVSGDLNGDGIPDLLVPANGSVNAYLGNGDGTFAFKSSTLTPSGGYLAVGDFNHDGKLDFATSGNLLALGNGDGSFQPPVPIVANPPPSGFSNIAVADINNDGWSDVVLVNSSIDPLYNAYVLLNNQQGSFNQVPTAFGAVTGQAILQDLNGDGNLDMVLVGSVATVAYVYLGDGTGNFTFDVSLSTPCCLGVGVAADVNGDGIPDITLLAVNDIEVFLGEGGGAYAAPLEWGAGSQPASLLVENLHGQPTQPACPIWWFRTAQGASWCCSMPRPRAVNDSESIMNPTKILATCALLCAAATISPSQTFTTLASFHGTDGAGPSASLIQGFDGRLYGTTLAGGTNQLGTVFGVTPSGALTALYSFNHADGASPFGGLALNTDGNLYGTTEAGGTQAFGTVFKITPAGAFTLLHDFCIQAGCPDGAVPAAGLVRSSDGHFYGTTYLGGHNTGIIYRISAGGRFLILYTLCQCSLGANPLAALVEGSDSNLYGTTELGGFPPPGGIGGGTIFQITRPGLYTQIYNFCQSPGCPDGANPSASLIEGANGSFYGTTYSGGAAGFGTVFGVTASGTLTNLYSFCAQTACTDGANPYAGLILATDGNFYGTTYYGGANDRGTLFRITPSGQLTTLYSFCAQAGCPDGEYVYGGLLQSTDGNLYGAAYQGGAYGKGTIFKLSLGLNPFIMVLPTAGKPGTTVKILGSDLTGATNVMFNGIAATFTLLSSSLISATVPTSATSGAVKVVTPTGTLSSNMPFRVRQ